MDQADNKDACAAAGDEPITSDSGDLKNDDSVASVETAENDDTKADENTPADKDDPANGNDASKNGEDNDDFTDAMMENLQENFNQDVDSMVSLMESAEEFMFESEDKQRNIKAAIEANKLRDEHQQISVINSDKSEAYSLLAQGKRNLFVKDYESAVTTLGEACQKLSSIYGEFAVELGDAYMTYGNALLELWRIEEAEKKNNEDETEEVKGEPENDNEKETNEDEANEEEENKETENDGDEEKEDGEGDEKANEEDGEEDIENEEDNLQIAWEVIELAKEIYLKHNDHLNLAKAYLKLGEISVASANYTLAIEDLDRSLEIQQKLDPVDNRLKANTHFNLYVAYAASHNYDKSAEQLNTAKSVFETQVYELSEKLKTLDKSNILEMTKIKNEINDTEEILRDMDSKILENNKHRREFMAALFEAIKNKSSDQSSSNNNSSNNLLPAGSSSTAPVNNISHLIHKKPKQQQEEQPQNKSSPAAQNSASSVNGSSPNSKTESANGSTETAISEESEDQSKVNEKKRKLSETQENDASPKKVCLGQE